jgi:transcriptional regulator with GAF, ATPase, and Fis domain
MATLWVEDDDGPRVVRLGSDPLDLGRGDAAAVSLRASGISRRHAEVVSSGEGHALRDLGSKNGVAVNGVRIAGTHPLADGDRITLGGARATYSAWRAAAAPEPSLATPAAELLLRVARRVLDAELDLGQVLSLTVDLLVGELGAARCFVVFAGAGDPLTFYAARNMDREDLQSPELEASRSVVTHVLESGRPVCVADMQADPRFGQQESVGELRLRSLLAAPIVAGAAVRGVLYLDDPRQPGRFSVAAQGLLVEVGRLVGRALEQAQAFQEALQALEAARAELRARAGFGGVVARSDVMRELLGLARRAAGSPHPLLITGETGTGKEVLARAVHVESQRGDAPFVIVSCAGLAEGVLESELFGHTRGAFSGAERDHAGLLAQADGGTLFLDELQDMSPPLQAKLLRVLEDGSFRPVGAGAEQRTDARVIAAANDELSDLVAAGLFREDLYFRLSVLRLDVPPLRQRPEDVPLLAERFLREEGQRSLEAGALAQLCAHAWPGNARELRALIRGLCALHPEGEIPAAEVERRLRASEPEVSDVPGELSFAEARQRFERAYLERALARCEGSIAAAAREVQIDRGQLHRTLKRLGINPALFKPSG